MSTTRLQDFITKTSAKNRITFGDVRRLQRDVLPDGISTREEVELLMRLDGQVGRADSTWTDWLVPSILDFMVWGEHPAGAVEGEAALWMHDLLAAIGTPTKASRRIAREIRRETDRTEAPMATFAPDENIPAHEISMDEMVSVEVISAEEAPLTELLEVTMTPLQLAA